MNDSEVLEKLISKLEDIEVSWSDVEIVSVVNCLVDAASSVGKAHSRSWLGWQALVYHENYTPPPPGSYFSAEYGKDNSMSMFGKGTTGNWFEYSKDDTLDHINKIA